MSNLNNLILSSNEAEKQFNDLKSRGESVEGFSTELHNVNLSILSRKRLENLFLHGAHLEEASFYKSFLENPNFAYANISDTDFDYARLGDANFSNSVIKNTLFRYSGLIDADFSDADIDSSSFAYGNLTNANFTGANINHVSFKSAGLGNANFSNITGQKASFVRSYLGGANFTNANLSHANFRNADLTLADFSGANLDGAYLSIESIASIKNLDQAQNLDKVNLMFGNKVITGIEIAFDEDNKPFVQAVYPEDKRLQLQNEFQAETSLYRHRTFDRVKDDLIEEGLYEQPTIEHICGPALSVNPFGPLAYQPQPQF